MKYNFHRVDERVDSVIVACLYVFLNGIIDMNFTFGMIKI